MIGNQNTNYISPKEYLTEEYLTEEKLSSINPLFSQGVNQGKFKGFSLAIAKNLSFPNSANVKFFFYSFWSAQESFKFKPAG